MRQKILKRLHAAHSGVESCLKLAREYVFWPGITAQVKEHVRRCQTWAMTGPSLRKETWAAEDAPTRPWQIVGVDLFEFETRQYLIVTDYFSSFWEIDNMTSTTSVAVIRKMKSIFARHGVPDKLRSDNGPQFILEQFRSLRQSGDSGIVLPARDIHSLMERLKTRLKRPKQLCKRRDKRAKMCGWRF